MDNTADLEEFLAEVGKSVALGLIPALGQAIDIYDTAYAAYDLYRASENDPQAREEALFNIGMAAIGWIPGPGDGIKHTLKTVNRNPEKFAPILLDAVRYALYKAGYKVDPYTFLMETIAAEKIQALIDGAKNDVLNSSIYQRCPSWIQQGMLLGMNLALENTAAKR